MSANYTNGFNYSLVMAAMLSRIGFRQSTKSGYTTLVDSDNLASTSNRYFNDFHAAATASNLKDTQEDSALGNAGFNTYLTSLKKSVIMRCLNAVFSECEYIEQVLLFDRNVSVRNEPIVNGSNFVGYAINVAQTFDRAVQVNGATLLFDADCDITLYLFKDGKKSSIWSQEVSVVADEATIVSFPDLVLNYIGAATKGSRFYFGYFQSEVESQNAKAINESTVSWATSKCFGAVPFYSTANIDSTNFNRESINYNRITYGLNLEISSFKDWTQIITKRANLFDEAIGLTMAYAVLEQIVYALRSNSNERLLKEGLQSASLIADLTGSAPVSDGPPPITGLNKRIEREIMRVKKSLFPDQKPISVNLLNSGYGQPWNYYKNPLPENVKP